MDAFAGIIDRYQDSIWKIAALTLRDMTATEDLVQQVFVDVFHNLESYQAGRDFGAWLRSIARNHLRKELRRLVREERKLRRYHQTLAARLDGVEAADEMEQRLRKALEACKRELSPSAAEALRPRYPVKVRTRPVRAYKYYDLEVRDEAPPVQLEVRPQPIVH